MKEEMVTDALLREFLLGRLNEVERERLERLFITDSQTRDRVLAAEQELIEDYLEHSLTTEDREQFASQYAQTPVEQRKLRITKSIRDWAVKEAAESENVPATISNWSRLRSWLRPEFVVPVAVAVLILIVAAVWLNSRMQERNRHLVVEQELARLNSPSSLGKVPPQTEPFSLAPVTVRSAAPQVELRPRADSQFVELQLLWIRQERYPTYRAVVSRVGEDRRFSILDLKPENDGRAIRLRLLTGMFVSGQYKIELTGIAADDTESAPEEYNFVVGR